MSSYYHNQKLTHKSYSGYPPKQMSNVQQMLTHLEKPQHVNFVEKIMNTQQIEFYEKNITS